VYGLTGNTDIHFEECALHDSDRTIFLMRGNWRGLIVDHCYIARNTSTPAVHREMLSMTESEDVVWSNNVMEDIEGTAFIAGINDGVARRWTIFGNVALYSDDYIADVGRVPGHNFGVAGFMFIANDASNDNSAFDFEIYNNTFYRIQGLYSGIVIQLGTGHRIKNNAWYDSVRTNNSVDGEVTHNWYFDTMADGETGGAEQVCTAACDIFIDPSKNDFRLKSGTSAGLTLPAPFDVDPDGVPRAADGTWDRGAFAFAQ
jgi:hypothetical protein